MNAGSLLKFVKEFVTLLETKGVLLPDGSFDQTKLDTVKEDVDFGLAVEALLKAHGLPVPEKIDKFIAFLPLIAGLFN